MSRAMYGLACDSGSKGYKDFDVPKSGPLDGDGRRSVYLEARRNYPLGLLMAFDQPRPMLRSVAARLPTSRTELGDAQRSASLAAGRAVGRAGLERIVGWRTTNASVH